MKCLICQKVFSHPKTFSTFFNNKELYICDSCYKRYKIDLSYNVIPLSNKKMLHIYSLFPKSEFFKGDPFIEEFSKLYKYVYNINPKRHIIVEYNIFFTNEKIKIYEELSKLIDDDLYILCNFYEI